MNDDLSTNARPRIRVMIGIALAGFLACGEPVRADAGDGLTVDVLTELKSFSLFSNIGSLSPDGRWLAYAVRSCRPASEKEHSGFHGAAGMRSVNEGCSDIWVTDTRTGETHRVTDGRGLAEDSAWSPDGTRLAFYGALDGPARLWVWNRSTKQLRRLSDATVRPSILDDAACPRWTPDGKYLVALLLPEGVNVKEANARLNSAQPAAKDPTVAPGASVMVYRAPGASKTAKTAAPETDEDPIRRETSDLAWIAMADVGLVDAATGEVRRVGRDKAVFWYAPSPDGKWIAYSHMTGARLKMVSRVFAIEVAPVNGGPTRVLAEDVYPDQGVCTWSPDGTRLAYLTGQEEPAVADAHVLDVATGADRNLTPDAPKSASWKPRLVPRWSPNGRNLLFESKGRLWRIPLQAGGIAAVTPERPDREIVQLLSDASGDGVWTSDGGRTVTVTTRNPATKDVGFYRVDVATGRATKLREEPKDYGSAAPLVSADGSFVVYAAQDAQHPLDLWGAGPSLAAPSQLTHINPQIEKVRLGTTRVVDYLGADRKPLRGALLLPPGYREGTPVPLIVQIYPGEIHFSNGVNKFGLGDTNGQFNMQMLATRGYAVLAPESPLKVGAPMKTLLENTNAAIDRVIELGIADADRLGVCGQSYGGFATVSLITQTRRFKAAVTSGGFADLLSFYGEMQDSGLDAWLAFVENEGGMGGSPWQYRSRYIENSPIFHLDRVTTPVLLLHGEDDTSVRASYSSQIFSGLRRLGREVEFRKYRGEGHVLEGRENIIDYWNAVIRWFETHLKERSKRPELATTRRADQ
jgi:dipeptidyl aminopeptidase/acylaminoacyl peptidase